MSLSAAFIVFIFLFFLVICLYFTWREVFAFRAQKVTNYKLSVEESPEWRAFVARRNEIEADPTLDDATKTILIENWQTMAAESKPHMSVSQGETGQRITGFAPMALPFMIGASLIFATLLTYSVGAIHSGSFTWPVQNQSSSAAPSVDQAVVAKAGHPGDGVSLDERLASLKERLEAQPDDLRGWVLLARTHASMSNFSASADALKKAIALTPGHPDLLADLADMVAMANNRSLLGEPQQYINEALQSDPRHEKALALAASAAEQAGDQGKAQVYWQLLSQVQQDSLKNAPSPVVETAPLTQAKVRIDQAAISALNSNSALFVFLKAQAGPGMPLAVVRVPAPELKAGDNIVRIGAGDFIQETGTSNLPEVLHAQARLSLAGMPQPGAGDVESAWASIPSAQLAAGVNLELQAGSSRP